MNPVSQTDSFLNLFLSFSNLNPLTVLSVFFLSMARLLPILVLAPFLGSKTVPASVRILFSVALLAILFPQILFSIHTQVSFDMRFTILFFKEILMGFILGFIISVPFYVAQSSGSLIDFMRGAQSLQVTDPTTSSKTGPLGVLYNYILIVIFFAIGGPFFFFDALGQSFNLIPVDKLFNPVFFSIKIPFWQLMIGILHYILSMSIQLAAPPFIGVLMAEMFLGITNRLAPQVQIVFLGLPLKSWIGLAMLAAGWYYILQQLGKESANWIKVLNETIKQIP